MAIQTESIVGDRVRKVMIDTLYLAVPPTQLGDETSLYSPLIQMDSLNLLHLIVALEEEFGREIDDEDVMEADLEKVGDLVYLVRSKISEVEGSE